jgi:hypothetical protein
MQAIQTVLIAVIAISLVSACGTSTKTVKRTPASAQLHQEVSNYIEDFEANPGLLQNDSTLERTEELRYSIATSALFLENAEDLRSVMGYMDRLLALNNKYGRTVAFQGETFDRWPPQTSIIVLELENQVIKQGLEEQLKVLVSKSKKTNYKPFISQGMVRQAISVRNTLLLSAKYQVIPEIVPSTKEREAWWGVISRHASLIDRDYYEDLKKYASLETDEDLKRRGAKILANIEQALDKKQKST